MKTTTKLTDSQKKLVTKIMATAKTRNEAGKGFELSKSYNQSWHKALAYLVESKKLIKRSHKAGYWLK